MLVLTRKPKEKIKIKVDGREILITITSIFRGKVRVGIDAPQDVKILRTEIEEMPEKMAVEL